MLHLQQAGKYIPGAAASFRPEALAALRKRCSIRRNDTFTLSMLAALLDSFGIRSAEEDLPQLPQGCAILTLSSLGPRKMIESFQNDLRDYPPENALPTTFSHSVNNAAAGCLAALFHLRGPSFSLTGFSGLTQAAWATAESILNTGTAGELLLFFAEDGSSLADAMKEDALIPVPGSACALLLSARKKEAGPDLALDTEKFIAGAENTPGFFELVEIFRKEFPES